MAVTVLTVVCLMTILAIHVESQVQAFAWKPQGRFGKRNDDTHELFLDDEALDRFSDDTSDRLSAKQHMYQMLTSKFTLHRTNKATAMPANILP